MYKTDIFDITQSFTVSGEMVAISLVAGVGFGISAICIIRILFAVNKIASHSKVGTPNDFQKGNDSFLGIPKDSKKGLPYFVGSLYVEMLRHP